MPFYWIESILAVSFTLVWVFIGMTLLGDRLSEVRQRRSAIHGEPQGPHFSSKPIRSPRRRRQKQRTSIDHIAV